jgi:hypothetical protein
MFSSLGKVLSGLWGPLLAGFPRFCYSKIMLIMFEAEGRPRAH